MNIREFMKPEKLVLQQSLFGIWIEKPLIPKMLVLHVYNHDFDIRFMTGSCNNKRMFVVLLCSKGKEKKFWASNDQLKKKCWSDYEVSKDS